MESPSEISRAKVKSQLLKDIPSLENEIQMDKEIIEASEKEDPDLCLRIKKFLEIYESQLASAKGALRLIEQDPYVGSVHNASCGNAGYFTVSSQCEIMMDLALIKIDCMGAESPQNIYLKEKIKPPRIQPHAVCDTWETDSLGVSHDGDGKNHIKVIGKLSRSGVYNFGIVNDLRALAFPFTENGVGNEEKHYMWVASSPASYSRGPFSQAGDSGSFVIAAADWEYCGYDNRVAMPSPQAPPKTRYESRQPFAVGLLFGGTHDDRLSYFIPFDAVKTEIESLTGEKMVWPRKRTDYFSDDVA
jgi:hypothetical protein